MAAMPIYYKNLKKSSTPEPIDRCVEIWYVAFCAQVLTGLFKLLPWVDLDLFYAKVKFDYIGFCMGKSENYVLFGNYCSHRPQSWFIQINKLMKLNEYQSQGQYLTLAKGHSDFKIKSCFSQKLLSHLKPNFN